MTKAKPKAQIMPGGSLADLQMAQESLTDQMSRQALLIAGHDGQLREIGTLTAAVQSGGAALQSTFSAWTAGVVATGAILIAATALVAGAVVWNTTELMSQREKLSELREGQARTNSNLTTLTASIDLLVGDRRQPRPQETPARPEN